MDQTQFRSGLYNAANIFGLAGIIALVVSFGVGLIFANLSVFVMLSGVLGFFLARNFLRPTSSDSSYKQARLSGLILFLIIVLWQTSTNFSELATVADQPPETLMTPAMILSLWICWTVAFVAGWIGSRKVKVTI